MSRIIIKNLPKVEEENLRNLFAPHGDITDLKLCYKKNGEFRHFACIGYTNQESTAKAIEALNNSNLKGQTISVELYREEAIKSSKGFKKSELPKPKVPKHPGKVFDDKFTVRIKGLPKEVKRSAIKKFFPSLKIASMRIPLRKQVRKGPHFAFVKFTNETDFKLALKKNKSIMDGVQVLVENYGIKKPQVKTQVDLEEFDTSRIFIRNLAYTVTENDITQLFESYGPLTEVKVPLTEVKDKKKQKIMRNKGIAFVSFQTVEKAQEAYTNLDRSILQGRILHLLPGKVNENEGTKSEIKETNFKAKKLQEAKENASDSYNWNTFYIAPHALAKLLRSTNYKSSERAVDQALLEVEMLNSIKEHFKSKEIYLDSATSNDMERSDSAIIIKNLNADTDPSELKSKFETFGKIKRFVSCPKSCLFALVEFEAASNAKKAFKELAYTQYYSIPLFLEWAPKVIFKKPNREAEVDTESDDEEEEDEKETEEEESHDVEMEPVEEVKDEFKLYVKNISFNTTDEDFLNYFSQAKGVISATVSRDKATGLSRGFGFVKTKDQASLAKVLTKFQDSKLDGHNLELQRSEQQVVVKPHRERMKPLNTVQLNSKILIKNVPFEATQQDLSKLFKNFGKVKVRLPNKVTGDRRGFAFLTFENKTIAKKAFKEMKDVHLYGKRLVLEWALN